MGHVSRAAELDLCDLVRGEQTLSRRLKIREIAERLGLTKPTVLLMLERKQIPGAIIAYVDGRGRNHWRVDRPTFEEWFVSLHGSRS